MSIQAACAIGLQFPAQGVDLRQINAPFKIHEFLSSSDLGVSAGVCTSWQGFVCEVARIRSEKLAAEGVRLDPSRILQMTVGSYAELKEKMKQFLEHLNPSHPNRFMCYTLDGRNLLTIKNRALVGRQRIESQLNEAPLGSNPTYIMTNVPPFSAAVSWTDDAENQVTMSLMQRAVHQMTLRGWQRGNGFPRTYVSLLSIQGNIQLQQGEPMVEELSQRVRSAMESIPRIQSKMQKQSFILFSHLSPELQIAAGEMLQFCLDLPCVPTVSTSYFVNDLSGLEYSVEWARKICEIIDEILEYPMLCEELRRRLSENLLSMFQTRDMQADLERYKKFMEEASASHDSVLMFSRRALFERRRPQDFAQWAPIFDFLGSVLRGCDDFHEIVNQHFSSESFEVLISIDKCLAFREFVSFSQQVAAERQEALYEELTPLQTRITHMREAAPSRQLLLRVSVFVASFVALFSGAWAYSSFMEQ